MKTQVFIISGFLGAGKTTLIQKVLKESLSDKKVALIENDFGEISVDATLLKSSGFQVKEMNAGCICCSLSGDFIKAMEELVERVEPEVIVIEPSGVGKLSDVKQACQDHGLTKSIELASCITLVDVKNCKKYQENFGEFFEDQVEHADHILFSRVEQYPDKISGATQVIRSINPKAVLHSMSWQEMDTASLLKKGQTHEALLCPLCHEHHHHDEHCDCHHHHMAEDVFDTLTLRPEQCFELVDLERCLGLLGESSMGEILRAKGNLQTKEGWQGVQYVPGELVITPSLQTEGILTIIGKDLDKEKITSIFGD